MELMLVKDHFLLIWSFTIFMRRSLIKAHQIPKHSTIGSNFSVPYILREHAEQKGPIRRPKPKVGNNLLINLNFHRTAVIWRFENIPGQCSHLTSGIFLRARRTRWPGIFKSPNLQIFKSSSNPSQISQNTLLSVHLQTLKGFNANTTFI